MSAASVSGHRSGVWTLVTNAEMQALDRQTIEKRGVPGEILMESAGRALAAPALALRAASGRAALPIRVFCGAGNNGGDGFVVARHLFAEGVAVEVILLGRPESLPADAAANWRRLSALGVPCRAVVPGSSSQSSQASEPSGLSASEDERSETDWAGLLAETSVAIDALFGTGLSRDLGGEAARLVEAISQEKARESNQDKAPRLRVLAVDIPSGIDADTGAVRGVAIEADQTITISLPKIGLALEPGRSHAGDVLVARVGIDDPDPERLPRAELWSGEAAAALFPERPRDGHKGRFGHVLVVAGAAGKMGAAALCSRAAARAGAGLITLVHPFGLGEETAGRCAEVMTAVAAATPEGAFARSASTAIEQLAADRDVVALGPGLSQDPETVALVQYLVGALDAPLVLDADALNALVGQLSLLHERSAATVLTPHPGEAARLLDSDAASLNRDRVGAARRLAQAAQSIVVLKGAATVVAEPGGRVLINSTGGPAMAAGGSGDVLTGIVAALLAAGMPAFEAAGLAVHWHGAAADASGAAEVGFGLLASELADGLPACAAEMIAEARRCANGEVADAALQLRFP
ncbi:MAG: NAD(P)H-hydrate dehydratase [Myxococcota bacterium]